MSQQHLINVWLPRHSAAALAVRVSALALVVSVLPACTNGTGDPQGTNAASAATGSSSAAASGQPDPMPAESMSTHPMSSGASQASSEQPSAADLAGTKWALVAAAQAPVDLAKFKITIEFTAGSVSGFAGVNRYNGSYKTAANGSIKFGPLATTKMAGEPDAMAAEAAYLKALQSANHYSADDTELTLVDPVGVTLKYAPAK